MKFVPVWGKIGLAMLPLGFAVMMGVGFLEAGRVHALPPELFTSLLIIGGLLFATGFALMGAGSIVGHTRQLKAKNIELAERQKQTQSLGESESTLQGHSGQPEIQDRSERAKRGGNSGERFAGGTKWPLIVLTGLTMFMFIFFPYLGIPLFIALIVILISKTRPHEDMKRYQREYVSSGLDGSLVIAERGASEDLFPLTPDTYGIQFSNLHEWVEAMWRSNGKSLLGRELVMNRVAESLGAVLDPALTSNDRSSLPVGLALENNRNAFAFQVRNVFTVSDSNNLYPIQVSDLNYIVLLNKNRESARTSGTSTYGETWFPSDHTLVVVPKSTKLAGSGVGEKITSGAPQFDKVFKTYSDGAVWARLVLNPAVMEDLLELGDIRMFISEGRIVVQTIEGWLTPEQVPDLIRTVRDIARSARAAEAQ